MSEFQKIAVVVKQHKDLLLRFKDTCLDLREVDPDEELELFGQIMDYRSDMQSKMEELFNRVQDMKNSISEEEFIAMTAENDQILKEIIELDSQNEVRLKQYQQSIFNQLKHTALNSKAISNYQTPTLVTKRVITDM